APLRDNRHTLRLPLPLSSAPRAPQPGAAHAEDGSSARPDDRANTGYLVSRFSLGSCRPVDRLGVGQQLPRPQSLETGNEKLETPGSPRQCHARGRARAAIAADGDRTVVPPDDGLRDRETDPDAARPPA